MVQSVPASLGGAGDIFLYVKGAKSGVIKGESQDSAHGKEIDVVSWSWGMQTQVSAGSTTMKGRAIIRDLKIVKRVDSASTPLMSALRTNEPITKAVLTQRKAGTKQLEFLKVTIEQGRVTELTIEAGDASGSTNLLEHVSFTFNKITVEYIPQGPDGQSTGSMMYTDQWGES